MNRRKITPAEAARVMGCSSQYGQDICTDVQVLGRLAWYTFQPGELQGYTVEVDLVTGKSHHKGKGAGSFWTDWEETY